MFNLEIILLGLLVFVARIADVSLGTIRTISIVQGRTKTAFWLGFVEVSLWLIVISAILPVIKEEPLLGIFYAFGFATGNIVGIHLERMLAFGNVVIRVISNNFGDKIAEDLRGRGFGVTLFNGEGLEGPVKMLLVISRRREVRSIVALMQAIDPEVFFTVDPVGYVNRFRRPVGQPLTGWRAIMKKK